MPCSICRSVNHNRQRCPILRWHRSNWRLYDFTIVTWRNEECADLLCEKVVWKGLRVDSGALVGNGRVFDTQSSLYNRGLVKWWLQNSHAHNITIGLPPPTEGYVPLRHAIICRANVRLLNAFATKLQRWWRTGGRCLEELPPCCPCPE